MVVICQILNLLRRIINRHETTAHLSCLNTCYSHYENQNCISVTWACKRLKSLLLHCLLNYLFRLTTKTHQTPHHCPTAGEIHWSPMDFPHTAPCMRKMSYAVTQSWEIIYIINMVHDKLRNVFLLCPYRLRCNMYFDPRLSASIKYIMYIHYLPIPQPIHF